MVDIKKLVGDDFSGALKAQKALLEMTDKDSLRAARQILENSSGINSAQTALSKEIERNRLAQQKLEEYSGIDSARKVALEEIKRIQFSPFDQYQKEMSALIASTRAFDITNSPGFSEIRKIAQESMRASYASTFSGIQNITAQGFQERIREIISPLVTSDIVSHSIRDRFAELSGSLVAAFDFRNSGVIKNLGQAINAATLSSAHSVARALMETNLGRNEDLLRQISGSLLGYDSFANRTLAQIRDIANEATAAALRGSLTLANEQLLTSTSLFQSYAEGLEQPRKSDQVFEYPVQRSNRFRVQKRELLRRDDIENGEPYESLVPKSVSATIYEQVVECMLLLTQCNEAAETAGGEKIFALTNTSVSSQWKLQQQVATSKETLSNVVTYLYFIFYEGAGSANLRFLTKGYLTDAEAKIVFVIKHLRNKWLDHDIEHGDASSIRSDFRKRKEALEWLGLERMPIKADDFVMLNSFLIAELSKFLKLLLERVSSFSKT